MSIQFIDFYADWCGPCVAMRPVVEELENELSGKVEIKKVDVDENQDEASKFGVMSIPTYLVIKDGEEVERFVGVTSKEVIKNKIFKHTSS
ncbi:MAG TPA: thioredoxin [Candidatus Nanoarchaeia archaeon]